MTAAAGSVDGAPGDATERAYAEIRKRIVTGEYPQGSPLTEAALSKALGVSRTPVRAALGRLNADGLVDQLPNRRVVVASWNIGDVEEIFGLRAVLESYGAQLATSAVTPQKQAELEALCDEMDAALAAQEPGWLAVCTALNNRFHTGVLEATGNARLIALVASIVVIPLTHRTIGRYTVRELERSWAEHRAITEAFRQGDAEWAGSIMRSHILTGRSITVHGAGHPTAAELDPLADPDEIPTTPTSREARG
jgi:DNA-binding GntR family transcriptional regulator